MVDSLNVLFLACKRFKTQLARIVTQERMRDHDSMSRALMEFGRLSISCCYIRIKHCMACAVVSLELVVPYAPRRVLRSAESNLLTVPPGKPGKSASANLWNSLRGERAAGLKNSPTVESFKRNIKNVPLL